MAKNRRTYTREFKIEAVRLLERSGRSQAEIAEELGVRLSNITRWKQEFSEGGEDAFPGRGRVGPQDEQIRRLERENEILRQEWHIPKKAVAIFSHPSK